MEKQLIIMEAEYRGYDLIKDRAIDAIEKPDGEWLIYDSENNLVGGSPTLEGAMWIVDEMYRQGVSHESELV